MEPEMGKDQYRECMRNHAATLGTYATDGCGEYTPADPTSPYSLRCAACGCHRNFHRKVVAEMGGGGGGGGGGRGAAADSLVAGYSPTASEERTERKRRTRTKFTAEQKEKMLLFAEKIGWKIQQKDGDEDEITSFCGEIGVSRQVFKVWMHNHKNSSSSSSSTNTTITTTTTTKDNASSLTQ